MTHRLLPLLVLAALTGLAGMAHAEKADRAKPMNIEADALRHDELKQTSVFSVSYTHLTLPTNREV